MKKEWYNGRYKSKDELIHELCRPMVDKDICKEKADLRENKSKKAESKSVTLLNDANEVLRMSKMFCLFKVTLDPIISTIHLPYFAIIIHSF